MLYDIHTGNPLDVPPLTQAFIATAEPYAVTEAQALKMLDGRAPGKHTFAEISCVFAAANTLSSPESSS
jgi:hypothetical protein